MKPRPPLRRVLLVPFALLLAVACNLIPPGSVISSGSTASPPGLHHFENNRVAFDYPAGMKLYAAGDPAFVPYPGMPLKGELVAGLADPRYINFNKLFRSIAIYRQPTGDLTQSMQAVYSQSKLPLKNGVVDASGTISFNGLPAYQKTYRVYSGEPAYELRDIWINKGDSLFIIAIWSEYTNPEDFGMFQALADAFLKSLVIK